MLWTESMRYKGSRDNGRVFQEGNGNGHASHFAPRVRARGTPVDWWRIRGPARSARRCKFHDLGIACDRRRAFQCTCHRQFCDPGIARDRRGAFQCTGHLDFRAPGIVCDCNASRRTACRFLVWQAKRLPYKLISGA